MKSFWMGLAGACIAGAALALWWQHYDAAFVAATVGALAWFLHYRLRMKGLIDNSGRDDLEHGESNESDEY